MSDTLDDLKTSYSRCVPHGKFIARFYETFAGSHPDVPVLFTDTDFSKWHIARRRGISAAIAYAGGSSLTKRTSGADGLRAKPWRPCTDTSGALSLLDRELDGGGARA